MNILFLFLLTFSSLIFAQRQKIDPISFGVVRLAEDRLPINVKAFKIIKSGKMDVKARMIKDSIQWVRYDHVLLLPRVLIHVVFKSEEQANYVWEYNHQKIIPLYNPQSKIYHAKIFISLFEALPLTLFYGKNEVSKIRIFPSETKVSKLIDYSCAPYSLYITGLESDYLSVGCKIQRTGKFGKEEPYLEVIFTSASYRLKDDSDPPYIVAFSKTGEARIKLENIEGKEEEIRISAKLPERLPRLKLAIGLGPYTLHTNNSSGKSINQIAPTAMLYGNFSLNESNSLRFFDSYSKNISLFHNWGVYYAWDLANFCDERCLLTSLIGVQGLDFKYNSNDSGVSEAIYPQGFEFIYKHPFGNLNYKFSYGMFASLSGPYSYNNMWIRYGKSYFWELNYIDWKKENRDASMWGISVGFPVTSFF